MNGDPILLSELLAWTSALPASMRLPTEIPAAITWCGLLPAVVADLHETITGDRPPERLLTTCRKLGGTLAERERTAWIVAACHVCWHPALRRHGNVTQGLQRLILQELPALATLVHVSRLDAEEERREELVRRCLRALDRRIDGETAEEADELLRQVDSVERQHLVRLAAERQECMRREEALRRKAEEEAASKVARE